MTKSDSLGISEMKEVVNLIKLMTGIMRPGGNDCVLQPTCPYSSHSQGQGSSSPEECQFWPKNKAFPHFGELS